MEPTTTQPKKAILDLEGANCTSCSIAIEHFGRRLEGVSDIMVDRATSTIQLEYNGEQRIVDQLIGLVDKLGYKATLRQTE